MRSNKKTFLSTYKEFIKNGKLCSHGLCNSLNAELIASDAFNFVNPTFEDFVTLQNEGASGNYWASDITFHELWSENGFINEEKLFERHCGFGILRQNLILFAAALNGEFE